MTEMDDFLMLAVEMAHEAGTISMRYFRKEMAIDHKADMSPVTIADRDSETAMRALIQNAFPDHGIIGEEHGTTQAEADYVWVLDPIDGTQSFVTGKPLFGNLISLTHKGTPILGIVNMPALNECWTGVQGRPTLFNDEETRVRPCTGPNEAWLYATSPDMFQGKDFAAFERLRTKAKRTLYGADCYAYGLLASGTVDLVCEADLKPYDFCALAAVVKGAGGLITDWQGKELTVKSDGRVLAAGDPATHAKALEVLTG